MPTHMRAQCCWQVGSLLPRDAVCINPCFRHSSLLVEGAPEWQTLADDLAAAVYGWSAAPTNHQLTVKLYEIKDPVAGQPNRPKATKVLMAGNSTEASVFRELAVCLSFYGGSNAPRERGRLYVPYFKAVSTAPGVRPDATVRSKVGELPALFAALGGVNVDWIVWSPTRNAATKVTNWWVDDEFDVQRRRGLRPTVRTAGTTSG